MGKRKSRPNLYRGSGPYRSTELDVVRDLMLGGRHSRQTVTRFGVSLPTADRWLKAISLTIPGVVQVRVGKTTWHELALSGAVLSRLADSKTKREARDG